MLRQAVPSLTPSMMFSLPPLDRYRHWLSGWAVALVGLVTTYWWVQQQWQSVAMVEQTRFTQEARAFTDALSQRVAANTEIVYGLHSLFAQTDVRWQALRNWGMTGFAKSGPFKQWVTRQAMGQG